MFLDFEKQIAELEGKIEELRHLSDEGDINIATEIPIIIDMINPDRTAPMLINIRMPSTSAVERDIKEPVDCLSWKAKLRC